MIKLVFIFLLATCLSLLICSRTALTRSFFTKALFNLVAILLLGSGADKSSTSIQVLAFYIVIIGFSFSFLFSELNFKLASEKKEKDTDD